MKEHWLVLGALVFAVGVATIGVPYFNRTPCERLHAKCEDVPLSNFKLAVQCAGIGAGMLMTKKEVTQQVCADLLEELEK